MSYSRGLHKQNNNGLCVFQSLLESGDICSPQLPLPCISSAATRVYFGHQRCQAEGEVLSFSFIKGGINISNVKKHINECKTNVKNDSVSLKRSSVALVFNAGGSEKGDSH